MGSQLRAGIFVVCLAWSPLIARAQMAPADAAGDIQTVALAIRQALQKLPPPRQPMSEAARLACDAADTALGVLLSARAEHRVRDALDAQRKRRACDDLRIDAPRDSDARARLQTLLAEATQRLTRCLPDTDDDTPRLRNVEVRDDCVKSAPALAAVFNGKERKLGDPPAEAVMLLAASKAQTEVDELRVKAKDAYDRGDRATAAAIELPEYVTLGAGADRPSVVQSVKDWAEIGRLWPRQLRRSITAAQAEADRLVAAALDLRQCEAQNKACADRPLVAGLVAKAAFDLHVAAAKEMDEKLGEAALGLAVIKAQPGITTAELKEAVTFRRLLETNPDVRSFFGGEAVGLTVGMDSSISLRYVVDLDGKTWVNRRNRLSFILSAPTSKEGVTRFVDSADALKNLTQVKAVWQLTNAPFKLPGIGTVNDFALGITAAQDTRTYFVENAATPLQPTEQKKSFTASSVGIRWAFLAHPESAYKTLTVFGFDAQRRYKSGDSATRCPHDPASTTAALDTCYVGAWGEPTRVFSRLVGLEVRQHMPAFDLGLKVKQDLVSDKVDVEIPVYLIRSTTNNATTVPFSAGVSVSRSKGDTAPRWALFVSMPLSFAKPDRP